jgi:hypothetical protein
MTDNDNGSPMTNAHLAALGQITIEYSRVEWMVSGFIWKLLAADQRIGQTVTASLTFSARVALLRSLFQALPPYGIAADCVGLNKALSAVEAANGKRNDVVHALLWHPNDSGELWRSNLERRTAAEWTQASASVEDLTRVSEELRKASRLVFDVMVKHFEPFGNSAWTPMGPGTLWGPAVQMAIAWDRQFGGEGGKGGTSQ